MLDQLEAAMALRDRYTRWRQSREKSAQESIATRFCRVFESHGVHRNQIPRFFGHGLTLEHVQDDASLLPRLEEPLLEDVCERFAVRREWLDGADNKAHPQHRFYKTPEDFSSFIKNLREINPDGDLQGVLIAPSDARSDASALLILQETVGWIGQTSIYRYHLCDDWMFAYWKARAYLTACVAIAWKHAVYIHGVRTVSKEIDLLIAGETLLGWRGEGISAIGHSKWYPEYMALRPEEFLAGLDPERNNFGVRSGLQLWLDLQRNGFMATGLAMYEAGAVRTLFESELAKRVQTGKG